MSLISVRTAIVNKLNDMQHLKGVYDYPVANVDGNYPYATVTLRRSDAEIRSTKHNLRTRSFWIRVYQEMIKTGQGPEQAERIMTKVVSEIEDSFARDTTLSGEVSWTEPLSWSASYRNREHDIRVVEIQLNTKELAETC